MLQDSSKSGKRQTNTESGATHPRATSIENLKKEFTMNSQWTPAMKYARSLAFKASLNLLYQKRRKKSNFKSSHNIKYMYYMSLGAQHQKRESHG